MSRKNGQTKLKPGTQVQIMETPANYAERAIGIFQSYYDGGYVVEIKKPKRDTVWAKKVKVLRK